jgi:hypothetical protein
MRTTRPTVGDTRVVTKFCWFPITDGKTTVWMEYATIVYEYVESYKYVDGIGAVSEYVWAIRKIEDK